MIKVKNYIETGFSIDDAEALQKQIEIALEGNQNVELDFDGIEIFTTLFFNNALTKYVVSLTPIVYEKKFLIENLSELGQMTYEHSLDNAKEYYNTPTQEREKINEIRLESED